MADFRIRARIEPADSSTFIAKIWVLVDGEEHVAASADVADVCHPCSREQAIAACKLFAEGIARHLARNGHSVSEISISG